ncbi:SIS domain-containing protein [Conexibacter sp. CPCC 206217]|uniref:SIS domain-containing protein n=1 Tax=Conexibacter sp. CPCC 206217 TaxID=3064574 RepID=UPI00271F690E|nr:SIS domain-containing protein [Conexibacter sp. CPCC 206217]MDO8209630.1 SIS domain-containing protein [Conexibacter sp. CPCC 206217]
MLNFDESRFRTIQSDALALSEGIRGAVAELLEDGADNLFFLGAGGAGVLMQPAAQLIERSCAFPVRLVHAAELMAVGDANLGAGSIVVIPSLSGTTREAVDVLAYAQERGAKVIALTGHADTPVARQADRNFTTFAEDDTSSESFYLQSLIVALAVVEHAGGRVGDGYAATVEGLRALPNALLEAKRAFEPRAREIAASIQHDDYHVLTAAGPAWTEAWYYGTCILEEMQWIRTRPIHAADFFHGTLELVEREVSVIAFAGEDASRVLVERVAAFAPQVTDRFLLIDAAEQELPSVPAEIRRLVPHVVLATLLERVSAHLEVLRDHPLTTRRYYRRMEY